MTNPSPNEAPTAQLISIDATTKALSVSRSSVYNLIASGALETVHLGRRRLIKVASVNKLAANGIGAAA